jgi:hypothetical protein
MRACCTTRCKFRDIIARVKWRDTLRAILAYCWLKVQRVLQRVFQLGPVQVLILILIWLTMLLVATPPRASLKVWPRRGDLLSPIELDDTISIRGPFRGPCARYTDTVSPPPSSKMAELLQEDFVCAQLNRTLRMTYLDCVNGVAQWEERVAKQFLSVRCVKMSTMYVTQSLTFCVYFADSFCCTSGKYVSTTIYASATCSVGAL